MYCLTQQFNVYILNYVTKSCQTYKEVRNIFSFKWNQLDSLNDLLTDEQCLANCLV